MKNNKISKYFLNVDAIIASVTLCILIVLTFAGVIWRRVLSSPFTWMEEVQLACMVWIVFSGATVAFRTGNHVAIEMVVDLFPEKGQKIATYFISAVVVFVLGYLFYESLGFINIFITSGRSTSILNIPYGLIYAIAPISFLLMIFNYFYGLKYPEEGGELDA